ncbi:hypothetical protein [Alicyclobacillus sp.]|uniref:hypothetical protein n=1 Tax=Alicyclobacillus sp. TaxID=61169 RepID=UPI0025B82121|nr:hypothetical protein [Alicyclobacillus sp.]MCL6516173.1 hypothetical protein [Alicyclobacillus sp.]
MESVISLIASVALASGLLHLWWIGLHGVRAAQARIEADAEWWNAWRSVSADIHGATEVQSGPGTMTLTTADGRVYRYSVNAQGQWVRTALSGGTSVLAVAVASVSCEPDASGVKIRVVYRDGVVRQGYAVTLKGAGL